MASGNKKLFSYSCFMLLCAGFVYSLILPFCWGNNPMDPLGTLSLLCEDRKIFFWLWVLLDGGAIILNMSYLFRKYGNSGKLEKVFQCIAFIAAVSIASTLEHSIADWNPKRIVHWIGTGCYVVFLFATLAVYALRNIKRGKFFVSLLISMTVIVLTFLLWFLILGKSGMLEIVPHTMLEVLLFAVNYIVKSPDKSQRTV